jgi:uncharacterized protein YukE
VSEIRVNTDDLRASSASLQQTGKSLDQILSDLSKVISSVDRGKYKGQLAAQVSSIASKAQSTESQVKVHSQDLATELTTRANLFDTANEAGASAMLNSSVQMNALQNSSPLMNFFAQIKQLELNFANSIFALGGFIGGAVTGMVTSIIYSNSTISYSPITLSVNVDGLNLRYLPSLNGEILTKLPSGSKVTTIGIPGMTNDGIIWVQVRTSDGKVGWIAANQKDSQRINDDAQADSWNKKFFIDQVQAMNKDYGLKNNVDCGPASLVMALSVLGIQVPGERSGDQLVDARKNMAIEKTNDGLKDGTLNVLDLTEHQGVTHDLGPDDIVHGANNYGADAEPIDPSTKNMIDALQNGKELVVSGSYKSDTWKPNYHITGGHIIAVIGYESSTKNFIIADPLTKKYMSVSEKEMESFMKGNANVIAISKR